RLRRFARDIHRDPCAETWKMDGMIDRSVDAATSHLFEDISEMLITSLPVTPPLALASCASAVLSSGKVWSTRKRKRPSEQSRATSAKTRSGSFGGPRENFAPYCSAEKSATDRTREGSPPISINSGMSPEPATSRAASTPSGASSFTRSAHPGSRCGQRDRLSLCHFLPQQSDLRVRAHPGSVSPGADPELRASASHAPSGRRPRLKSSHMLEQKLGSAGRRSRAGRGRLRARELAPEAQPEGIVVRGIARDSRAHPRRLDVDAHMALRVVLGAHDRGPLGIAGDVVGLPPFFGQAR